jgi:hypothetical protein
MGTGLEMKVPGKSRKGSFVVLGLAALMLAGCSNDPARLDRGALVANVARGAGLSLPWQTAPAATPLASPEQVLAATQVPVISAQTAQGDRLYLLGVRDNGPYRTYATATRQTITLRGGLITATRGLGRDLMSADVAQTLARLAQGNPGPSRRSMEVLDGEDVTRILQFDCQISQGAHDLPALRIAPARLMQEACRGVNDNAAGLTFTNSYAMDRNGRILASRQWLPVASGAMVLEELRP